MSAKNRDSSQHTKTLSQHPHTLLLYVEGSFWNPPRGGSTCPRKFLRSFPPSSNTSIKETTTHGSYRTNDEIRGSLKMEPIIMEAESQQYITKVPGKLCSRILYFIARLSATAYTNLKRSPYGSKLCNLACNATPYLPVLDMHMQTPQIPIQSYEHIIWLWSFAVGLPSNEVEPCRWRWRLVGKCTFFRNLLPFSGHVGISVILKLAYFLRPGSSISSLPCVITWMTSLPSNHLVRFIRLKLLPSFYVFLAPSQLVHPKYEPVSTETFYIEIPRPESPCTNKSKKAIPGVHGASWDIYIHRYARRYKFSAL